MAFVILFKLYCCSIGECNKQIEKIQIVEAEKEIIYQQKLDVYNDAKKLFYTLIGNDFFCNVIDHYIEVSN